LVKYIVKGYSSFGAKNNDYEGLISEGNISLLKAIEKFDLNSKNRFATYAGYWIRQYIQSFMNKNQLITQGPTVKDRKNLVYYDNNYQNEEKENKSYSLMDTLDDSKGEEVASEKIRQKNISIQVSDIINKLKDREKILITRL
jgi:RNA polymerase sigma factor (sigma-70 family)